MKNIFFFLIVILLAISSCKPDPIDPAVYDPTPYVLDIGEFPDPLLPADNPLTLAGVELGRMLFYEKDLSRDRSQSCADCHLQEDAFSDYPTL